MTGARISAYTTEDEKERWEERAEELDMNFSEFVCSMIRAGTKKFEVELSPDRTNAELREQRDDLRQELQRARERIGDLEQALHTTERDAVRRFIRKEDQPTEDDVAQYLSETAPDRVEPHIDQLKMSGEVREIDGVLYME